MAQGDEHPILSSKQSQDHQTLLDEDIVSSIVKAIKLDQEANIRIVTLPLHESTRICDPWNYEHFDFIERWDEYKDTFMKVPYEDAMEEAAVKANTRIYPFTTCRHGPRILLGIMTMKEHPKEGRRRAMIRKTYLSHYNSDSSSSSSNLTNTSIAWDE